jgi:cytochrome c oxidase subunit 1
MRGRAAERNPWQATTLDWATASPPPHGNFDRPLVVVRGPYVYSPPSSELDFIPQYEEVQASEPSDAERSPLPMPVAAE